MSEREILSWEDVVTLTRRLAEEIAATPFDVVLAVSRGGLVPAAVLTSLLERRDVVSAALASYRDESRTDRMTVYNFPPDEALRGRRVLIVDDIWDSGHTAMAIRDRVAAAGGIPIVAVLHYKPVRSAFREAKPDHWVVETDRWIVYPWEALRTGPPGEAQSSSGP